MTIGYLSGKEINSLIEAGATQAYYGVSENPNYRGDIVSVYFLNDEGYEIAHQTQLSGECGWSNITFYKRKFGNKENYTRSYNFERIIACGEIVESRTYYIANY